MWQFAASPYIQAIRKAAKHQNNNLFFKSALLISTVSTSAFQSTNFLLFACHHISTFSVAPFFPYKHTQPAIPPSAPTKGQRSKCQFCNSLRWPIYAINSIDNTQLPCYTLPPTQHHSFLRNLPPFLARELRACARASYSYDVENGTRLLARSVGRFL